MSTVPVLLIKNEELWIQKILTPLSNLFEHVIVADTGSIDSTLKQIAGMDRDNITLFSYSDLTHQEVGQCRGWMQDQARSLFGADWIFLIDGDELYPTKYLKHILDNPMPAGSLSGFTSGVECAELPNGECWLYSVGVNRQAFISVDSKWKGEYPFESPDTYKPGDPKNYYWTSPDPSYRFFHIHQMRRSSRDEDVYMRVPKRFQFSMQDHPEIKPVTFWLKSREEYIDE
jgi:glycosyltransferase involved in cell wall biosynthesis